MKKKVYIASPYSHGDVGKNVKLQMDTAIILIDNGYVPFVPLLNHFLHMANPRKEEVWMDYDMEWLNSCDILLRLPGKSPGADAEVRAARLRAMPVYHSLYSLMSADGFKRSEIPNSARESLEISSASEQVSQTREFQEYFENSLIEYDGLYEKLSEGE